MSRRFRCRGEVHRTAKVRWRPDYLDQTIDIECAAKHVARVLKALRAEFRREKLAAETSEKAFEKARKAEVAAIRAARLKVRRARR